jgi:hypothetical protein
MPPRKSVSVSDEDQAELDRIAGKLSGMKESQIMAVLLHYGIWKAARAFSELLQREPELS